MLKLISRIEADMLIGSWKSYDRAAVYGAINLIVILLVFLAATNPVAVFSQTNEAQESNSEIAEEEGGDQVEFGSEEDDAYPHLELLTEALMHIRKHYVDEKTYKEIVYGALHGMMSSLDSHSSFLEKKQYKAVREGTSGAFSGIGIHIGIRDGYLTIIAPIEDTPAFRAGLQAGDRIVEIDGIKTAGVKLGQAVKKLRGKKGTDVSITVLGIGNKENRDVTITRDDIKVPSVKGAAIIRDGVGYVRITQFAQPTAELLQAEIDTLLGEGMEALVLDLRNNPGGLLRSAMEITEMFLDKNEVIVTTRGREEKKDAIITKALRDSPLPDIPLAVLVNGGSASASEIVAGALQDHGKAVLVGSKTFGKGSVQSVIPLRDDDEMAVRLTIAYYYTPNGRLIHDKGLDPEISVEISPKEWRRAMMRRVQVEEPALYSDEERESYADAVDTQLERAVDMLQAVKVFK